MADAFETGDAAYVAKALGVVARNRPFPRTALPFIQRTREPVCQDNAGGDARTRRLYDSQDSCFTIITVPLLSTHANQRLPTPKSNRVQLGQRK